MPCTQDPRFRHPPDHQVIVHARSLILWRQRTGGIEKGTLRQCVDNQSRSCQVCCRVWIGTRHYITARLRTLPLMSEYESLDRRMITQPFLDHLTGDAWSIVKYALIHIVKVIRPYNESVLWDCGILIDVSIYWSECRSLNCGSPLSLRKCRLRRVNDIGPSKW